MVAILSGGGGGGGVKICVEYRNMVCQEAEANPANRSRPWVPCPGILHKSQIVLWHTFSCVGGVGNLVFQDYHSALCHCTLSSEWGCSSDSQLSQSALHGLRCSRMKTLSDIYSPKLVILTNHWCNPYQWKVFHTVTNRVCIETCNQIYWQ